MLSDSVVPGRVRVPEVQVTAANLSVRLWVGGFWVFPTLDGRLSADNIFAF